MTECITSSEKEKKQKQAILYAIENYPIINRTKLMKFVFFIDLFIYNKRGDTLLDNCYIRLPKGPVPQFGFDYTDPKQIETKEFTISRVPENPNEKYFHYQFNLKPEVKSDLSNFSDVEKDLLNLTLQTVISKKTADLSMFTHTYDLWKKTNDGHFINLEDFKLNDEKEDELEKFLNTKIYVTSLNQTGFFGRKNKSSGKVNDLKKIEGLPDKLPIYINKQTGEIIKN